VTVNLAGRVFEQLSLDINVINPDDPRPIELVKAQRNPFDFIDEITSSAQARMPASTSACPARSRHTTTAPSRPATAPTVGSA
jgi:hypothetical protein